MNIDDEQDMVEIDQEGANRQRAKSLALKKLQK